MTICVAVKVSEGLVLAADSAAAIEGWIGERTGPPGILKTYEHVRKLSHIKDYPIGTLTWGVALIGARSVDSLIKEYEHGLPSSFEEQEKAKERQRGNDSTPANRDAYSVHEIADGLLKHIRRFYDNEFAAEPESQRPPLGILVSGYSSGKFFPEMWKIELPVSVALEEIRPDKNGKPDFGAHWYGLADAIVRLHWGRDDKAIDILAERFKTDPKEIREVLDVLQYPIVFNGMPLQDAIDYAVYLVNLVIGRFRFVAGAPLCGGEADVAVITPDKFTWIHRKLWDVRQGPTS